MKILVCISYVPDTTTKITFKDNNTRFNESGVQYIINPADEYALARALEIKEQIGGTVTAINVGLVNTEPVIRKALATGADDAIRINAEPMDASFVAFQIAQVANGFDMILTGKESIDFNGGQVAGMVGEFMNLPSVSIAIKLDIINGKAVLEREIDGGKEIVETVLPCVIACQKPMAEPRIPNMRGIMTSRTKPLKVVQPVTFESFSSVENYSLPVAKSECKLIPADRPELLIEVLKNEIKVI